MGGVIILPTTARPTAARPMRNYSIGNLGYIIEKTFRLIKNRPNNKFKLLWYSPLWMRTLKLKIPLGYTRRIPHY